MALFPPENAAGPLFLHCQNFRATEASERKARNSPTNGAEVD